MITWRLGPDHAAQWREIRLAMLRDVPQAFGATLAEWQDRPLSDFAKRLRDVPTFAAGEGADQPLAVASWSVDQHDLQRGWLFSVYARPAARGQGYAEAAIRATLDDAAQAGMVAMDLNVRVTARHAQALYRRMGFSERDAVPAAQPDEIRMTTGLP